MKLIIPVLALLGTLQAVDLQSFTKISKEAEPKKSEKQAKEAEKKPEEVGSDFDRELFKWHNKLRADPKAFIPDLEELSKAFKGKNR